MKKTAFFLSVLLSVAIAQADGGAASLVAKKSSTGYYAFSEKTQQQFIQDCSANANEQVCRCVLEKIQQTYSEKEYLKLDASLRKGYGDYEFESFISSAVSDCDEQYANSLPKMSEEEATAYADTLLKNLGNKKEYIPECTPIYKDIYGITAAKQICGCFYDRFTGDRERLIKTFMTEGIPDDNDNDKWGMDYTFDCLPDKFTPEIEKAFVNYLNQSGLPKSMSQCFVKSIKKEYSPKIFATIRKDPNALVVLVYKTAGECFLGTDNGGLGSSGYSSGNKLHLDYSKILEALDEQDKKYQNKPKEKRSESEYRYSLDDDDDYNQEYAERYAKIGSGGVGDGMASLGVGGIATKAKGSIKTPSERDITVTGKGNRSTADIMKVVRQRSPGLRHIYNKFLKKKPGFLGKVTLKFTIARSGEITSIEKVSSTTGFSGFDNEIKNAVSRWKFGKIESGKNTVTIPFTFSE